MNAQCTWRRRTGLPNVYHTAIRRALSPLHLCGSVIAEVHGCPRGVAPLRPSSALRDNPVARPGGATTPSPHHATGCAAHPPLLFVPPGHGLATTRYASEPIDIAAYERNRERGRQSVYVFSEERRLSLWQKSKPITVWMPKPRGRHTRSS